jgi:hypothetical protein
LDDIQETNLTASARQNANIVLYRRPLSREEIHYRGSCQSGDENLVLGTYVGDQPKEFSTFI